MVQNEQDWDFAVGTSQLINLRETVQRWSSAVNPLAESRSLNLSVSCDTALPDRIYTEPQALNYIVAELMIIAVRCAVTDRIGLSLQKRGASLAIVVCDTGIGLPPKPSKPGSSTLARTHEIKALASPGLSTVRRLTQLLGGSVMIFSQSNGGTTLTVLLPLVTASDAPTQPFRP